MIAPGIVLRADAVTKRYGEVKALDGVSIAVRRGHCVALIGESGSGKTTLTRSILHLETPTSCPSFPRIEEPAAKLRSSRRLLKWEQSSHQIGD